MCDSPEYASICQRRDPAWVCKVLPLYFVDFLTNTLTDASVHNVIRRLSVQLVPRESKVPLDSRSHMLQIMGDEYDVTVSKLNRGRLVDSAKINIKQVKNWIDECEQYHGLACTPDGCSEKTEYSLRLVDVQNRCLVVAPSHCEYVALSYTWGDPQRFQHLKLTNDTSDWLRSPGALVEENSRIPTTIKDALALTEKLGVRYLWIDAICIQQDDEKDKLSQIPNMNRIYGRAKVTVVAGAGSDAWSGLPGAGNNPKPRSKSQSQVNFKGMRFTTVLQPYHEWRGQSAWDSRGWTFQEKVLSKRLLIFGTEQVYFQCKTDLWYEDTFCENFDPNIHSKLLENDNLLGGSPYTQYEILVMNYTHRAFGFQDDVLNAFRGLENILRPALTDEFHWGLPTSMFDTAISWTFPYHYPSRRRVGFPSWSWAGWDFSGIWAGYTVGYPHQKSVGREVLWYRLAEDPPTVVNIDSAQPGFALKSVFPNVVGEIGYTAPSNRESVVKCPVSINPNNVRVSHILQFWASSAYLRVGRTDADSKRKYENWWYTEMVEKQNNIFADIHGKNDKAIGQISMHRDWRSCKPDELEFIAISRFCPYSTLPRNSEGFHLLLVEWHGDIAYRVQAPIQPITRGDWLDMKPVWKLITLA